MVGAGVGEAMMGVELAGCYGVGITLVRTPTMDRSVSLDDLAVGKGQSALKERCFSATSAFSGESQCWLLRSQKSKDAFPYGFLQGHDILRCRW